MTDRASLLGNSCPPGPTGYVFSMRSDHVVFYITRVLPEDYFKDDPCNFPWDGELVKNRARVDQHVSNSVYKILAWRFPALVLLPRVRKKSSWLELDQESGVESGS